MHDIGNVVNRSDHAQSGALMAFTILNKMQMHPAEIALVVAAIGNHDEGTASAVNPIAAALILSDKSDVRRSRVRDKETVAADIHDRVNDAVERSELEIHLENRTVVLNIVIDTTICPCLLYTSSGENALELFFGADERRGIYPDTVRPVSDCGN